MKKPEKPVMMMSNQKLSRVLAEQYWIDYGQFLYKKHKMERAIKTTNFIGAVLMVLFCLIAIFCD